MYQTLEIYMARKKQVPAHYNPDSQRIFDGDIGDDSIRDSKMNKLYTERKNPPPPPHPREPERRNCPHPWHSRFLRHNVRLLNEPICVMATDTTDNKQSNWWPSRVSEEEMMKPNYTKTTTQRSDYQHSAPANRNTRHGSNPFVIPTKGITPVNVPLRKDDPGHIVLERISYNHDYNARLERNEPIRGKLHGSFVYDEVLKTADGANVVLTPWNRRKIHRCVTVPCSITSSDKNKQKIADTKKSEIITPEIQNAADDIKPQEQNEVVKQEKENQINENQKNNSTIPAIDGLPSPNNA